MENNEIKISFHELNKQMATNLSPLSSESLQETIKKIDSWRVGTYHLLYGKDIGYFTLLHNNKIPTGETFGEIIIDCLSNLGTIVFAEETEKSVWEFWIKDNNQTPILLYLFEYDKGVVHYGE